MTPTFPPLLSGEEVAAGQDPFDRAVALAAIGTDAGLICWSATDEGLKAAIVFAPEEPLSDAITGIFAVALGLGDALGALAPPEVAVHYVWPNRIRVNGAGCGHIRANASTSEPTTVPDWLIVGIEMPFSDSGVDPGNTPGRTCLLEEGCGEMSPVGLLESWSRHMLTWINRREQDGFAPLHAEWRSRAWGLGEPLPDGSPYGPGAFVGLDEFGGMLVKTPDETRLVPLTEALE